MKGEGRGRRGEEKRDVIKDWTEARGNDEQGKWNEQEDRARGERGKNMMKRPMEIMRENGKGVNGDLERQGEYHMGKEI